MSKNKVSFNDLDDEGKQAEIDRLRNQAASSKEQFGKGDYYSWRKAIDDVKQAKGVTETAVAGGKWAGKSLFNMGKYALSEGIPASKKATASKMEKVLKDQK